MTNLLDMTRIEAGVLTLHRVATPVGELVDEAVRVMIPTFGGQKIDVSDSGPLPDVVVDRVLIGQVLVNLLDNALRHAPPNSLISVEYERRDDHVIVSVADQGPGVLPGDRETIFDRFTQLNTGGRAGLGLTIAKTFVEAHGEHLWYEENPGGGARFVFSLPTRASKTSP